MAYKTAEERIRWVIERIGNNATLTDGDIIKLSYGRLGDVFEEEPEKQFRAILTNLEKDGHISINKLPYSALPAPKKKYPYKSVADMFTSEVEDPDYFDEYFHIRVLPSFSKFFAGLQKPHQKITVRSYDPATGTLYFGGQAITFVQQKNRLKSKNESLQARALRLLFHNVNSLKNGVPLIKIVRSKGVVQSPLKDSQRKQAKNNIAEINRKFREVNSSRSLIKIRKEIFYIDPELLEKD